MKRTLLILTCLIPYLLYAQAPVKKKKYPSLLWEITGKGLKKPSFLFGTMHVSSKMAFHLADSFYVGIRNADMVALETNPESWQEDMSKYDLGETNPSLFGYGWEFTAAPEDYLRISTLKFYAYDKKIERTLYSNPSTINNLLYRSYGNESSDFEEDTYLDMYIYQCGKKWGKKVAGVEKYGESMKLMAEAYKDAAKDKNKKEKSYDAGENFSSGKLQEAYRTGNLDWLDSINRYNSFSSAFDEKFLYRRNEIQAGSIDSILRTGQSLFVGVGAAHLPGNRGVIEILRRKGYNVRPVKMAERNNQHKTDVEKLRVPVMFTTQTADDGLYKVDIPGRFYKFGDDASLDQRQYADMANGSYYMVTRIMTNALMWGHSTDKVFSIIDSLLYENIPGKIIARASIVRNGYRGLDIVNRTRRGDLQRYNIFVTPFEIIVFKMSGTGDYIKFGDEAKRFFSSIQLKEFNPPGLANTAPAPAWKKYSPSYGGFAINLPHDPYIGNDGSWIYDAEDRLTHTGYRVIRTDIHNYHFAEQDTFDLALLDESFASSDFIDKSISRHFFTFKGYPALDVTYKDKSTNIFLARFILQGPHYYTLVAHGKQETAQMKNFLNSFEIKPFIYRNARERRDTSLYYSVLSPVFPESLKEKINMPQSYYFGEDDNTAEDNKLDNGVFRSKIISNDTTGEKIYVSFFKAQPYLFVKDTSRLDDENRFALTGDTNWIVRSAKKYSLSNGTRVWESQLSDSASSRAILCKAFHRKGAGYILLAESDTLTPPSDFIQSFFNSFTPADSLEGPDPYVKKSGLFFSDFMSTDSVLHKRAVNGISIVEFDSADLPALKKVIASLSWKEKKYLDVKKSLIAKLDVICTKESVDYLRSLYYAAGDTVELQYTVLEMLLQQKTAYAYSAFRDIMIDEPPVIISVSDNSTGSNFSLPSLLQHTGYDNGNFLDDLDDSLVLIKPILPDLLPLMNLDDYKFSVIGLLSQMVDSGMVKAKDYETYFPKFLLEARQELKRQSIDEKSKAIKKTEQAKEDNIILQNEFLSNDNTDYGNDNLVLYATVLLPFWDSKPSVPVIMNQLLASQDKRLKYSTLLLLIRNERPYPDSMLTYFAKLDEYRYELYSDLKSIGKENKFPGSFNNHIDLAKSKLVSVQSYAGPDSLVYLNRLAATIKNRSGFVYFFKYKMKKDDDTWKLATAGLVPENPNQFEFVDSADDTEDSYNDDVSSYTHTLTSFTNTKLDDDKSLLVQLKKQLKKILYSRRKSAKEFYANEEEEGVGTDVVVEEGTE